MTQYMNLSVLDMYIHYKFTCRHIRVQFDNPETGRRFHTFFLIIKIFQAVYMEDRKGLKLIFVFKN